MVQQPAISMADGVEPGQASEVLGKRLLDELVRPTASDTYIDD